MSFHHFCHFLVRGCSDFLGMLSVDQKVGQLFLELLPDNSLLRKGQEQRDQIHNHAYYKHKTGFQLQHIQSVHFQAFQLYIIE